MGENKEKIVEYESYCEHCKFYENNENDEPCETCLTYPVNTNSHRPTEFVERDEK